MPFRKKKYRQGHDLDPNVVDWRGHQWCLACEEGGLLKRGRQRTQKPNKHGPRTHCQNNHEYTPENTQITKDGGRRCVKCMNSYKTRPHSVKPAPIPKPELQAVERGNEWWRADYEAGLARALAKQKANLEVIAAKAEQATYSRSDMKWLFVGEAA